MDIDVIAKYSRLLGLGDFTHVDLPNETRGLVPDREWKMKVAHDKWYPGETISVAIGQGPILATALQMLRLYSAIATDGRLIQPHVVGSVLDYTGKLVQQSQTMVQQIKGIDRENFEFVKKALWGVVNDAGTGGKARVDGYDVCGKTGTVQVVGYDRGKDLAKTHSHIYGDHAWFISFAPLEDPQVAIAVFVEHGGHGADAAAPVAKKVFEAYFAERKIAPFSPLRNKPAVAAKTAPPPPPEPEGDVD